VTSTSICANGAAFEDAVTLARAAPSLAVGVHLTLVGETPLSDPGSLPRLAPGGRFPGYFTGLFARLLIGGIPEAEIERELDAQVARVHETGLCVSHLDSHQHVHLHPKLLPVVLRVARRFGIAAVRAAGAVSPFSGIRPALLSLFSRRAASVLREAGLRTPDASLGLAESGRLDENRLRAILAAVPDGVSELVCHPGIGTDAISRTYPWGFRWDDETRALTAPQLRPDLEDRGIALLSYRDL
jgi:predicted glycoside hydrolase/deacetylase ChbG (UPF0249 family)